SSPGQIWHDGRQLFVDGSVVDLTLIAHDDEWQSQDTNIFFYGAKPERKNYAAVWDNAPVETLNYYGNAISRPAPVVHPGDGEDAYPGGRPGDGGAGGSITTSLPLELVAPLCDANPGAAGPETAGVPGGPAGGPIPAFAVEMHIVKSTFFQSSRS